MQSRDWIYGAVAVCLGIVWCVPVLGLTRGEWTWWPASGIEYLVLSIFVTTSLFIAICFRSWIRWARGARSLLIGTVLMLAGIFGTSLLITVGLWILEWSQQLESSSPPSLLDLYGCLYFGLLFAGYYFYVSVPMGVASVALLRWIDGRNPKQKAARSSQVAAATSTRAL